MARIAPVAFSTTTTAAWVISCRFNADKCERTKRSLVFALRFVRVPPRIESGRRLRQTGQENCFAQSEIARRFSKVCASGGLGTDSAISVAASIQVFRQNSLLTPAPFQFPGDHCLVEFAAPPALLTT